MNGTILRKFTDGIEIIQNVAIGQRKQLDKQKKDCYATVTQKCHFMEFDLGPLQCGHVGWGHADCGRPLFKRIVGLVVGAGWFIAWRLQDDFLLDAAHLWLFE